MSDLVSIIIPYYKKKLFFKKTIDSIKNQTYKNFEIILIYDDSNRSDLIFVKKTLKKIKNKNIIINKKNMGAGISRNYGIKKSKGKFLSFLDSDDVWDKNKLKKQIKFMKNNCLEFSYSNYSIIDEKGILLKKIKSPNIIKFRDLLFSCDIALSSVIINSKLLKSEKFPNLKTKEDYLLWLKLSKKNIKMMGIDKNFVFWRKTHNSLSSSVMQKLKDAFLVYNKYLKINFLFSIILIFFLSINSIIKRYL
ncbi:glycosyltransferase family 2 protein [Pelagibacterales bacterium SAG-MED20]|nr:glycosyltransferase family 2 protein [Pelagibacterales bacterium SAG-MED20]